jgi:hypothetical protein
MFPSFVDELRSVLADYLFAIPLSRFEWILSSLETGRPCFPSCGLVLDFHCWLVLLL